MMKLYYSAIDLPTGIAFAAATSRGISRLDLRPPSFAEFMEEIEAEFGISPVEAERPFTVLKKELNSYFRGEPVSFTVRLDVRGTEFQNRVWDRLRNIPYGNVRSYKWLAAEAGNPAAARAVGGALNRNRVAVVIPCHRVVESSGGLGGFGSGIEIKKRLLEIEGVLPKLSSLLSA
ncbi:MAG: methylated-DNA--[protein]-cysteine S-methyltransferase [Nitrospirota bacterium]